MEKEMPALQTFGSAGAARKRKCLALPNIRLRWSRQEKEMPGATLDKTITQCRMGLSRSARTVLSSTFTTEFVPPADLGIKEIEMEVESYPMSDRVPITRLPIRGGGD